MPGAGSSLVAMPDSNLPFALDHSALVSKRVSCHTSRHSFVHISCNRAPISGLFMNSWETKM